MTSQIYVLSGSNRIDPEFFTFNGGEESVKVKLPPEAYLKGHYAIYAYIRNSSDLMRLMLLSEAVKEMVPDQKAYLNLPYLPYARQDRRCADGEAFSLKVVCNMINSMEFYQVSLSDPHSDVGPALINNVSVDPQDNVYYNSHFGVMGGAKYKSDTVICAPDGGALKKAFKVAQRMGCELITAEKMRDMDTGNIIRTVLNCGDLEGKRVIMVDDICDGGYTFIKLAEELYKKNARQVDLWVSHGIFSKGKEVLHEADIVNVDAAYDWTTMDD